MKSPWANTNSVETDKLEYELEYDGDGLPKSMVERTIIRGDKETLIAYEKALFDRIPEEFHEAVRFSTKQSMAFVIDDKVPHGDVIISRGTVGINETGYLQYSYDRAAKICSDELFYAFTERLFGSEFAEIVRKSDHEKS